jgi:hypothetical protein
VVAFSAIALVASSAGAQSSAEARRARAEELVRGVSGQPPLVRGRGRPIEFRRPLEELVKLGAEGQVAALRMVPKARDLEAVSVLYFLGTELGTKPLAEEAVKPAAEALPVVMRLYLRPPEGVNDGPKMVLAAMARTPGLLEPVLDALTAQPLGEAVVMNVVGGAEPKALGPALVRVAADSGKPDAMRAVAVQGLGRRKEFRDTLLAVARGEVPAALRAEKAPAGGGARYRFDDAGGAAARGSAMLMLASKTPTNAGPPAELAGIAEAALGSPSEPLRKAAAAALGRMGPAGQEVLAKRAVGAGGAAVDEAAMAELTRTLPYPKALLADRAGMARPEVREAAARVIAVLKDNAGKPADAARALDRIVEDPAAPAELRRQATMTLLNGGDVTRAVSDARLGELLASKFAEVRVAAAKALAEVQELRGRAVTQETLVPLLEAPEGELRRVAVERLLPGDVRFAQVKPEVALAAVKSRYDDVRGPAAKLLAGNELLRGSVGLVTGREVMRINGKAWEGPGMGAEGAKATWPGAGSVARAPVTAAAAVGKRAGGGGGTVAAAIWVGSVLALAGVGLAPLAALVARGLSNPRRAPV